MTDNDKSVVEKKMPVYRGGRMKGQLNTYSKDGIRRLAQLGFDPMEQMVKLSKDIDKELYKIKHYSNGTLREKFSMVAYAQLLATQQKLINDLMRYGYSRVPETEDTQEKVIKPVVINLSKKGDTYLPTTNYEDAEFVDMADNEYDEDSIEANSSRG
jgi:hypothetical protein